MAGSSHPEDHLFSSIMIRVNVCPAVTWMKHHILWDGRGTVLLWKEGKAGRSTLHHGTVTCPCLLPSETRIFENSAQHTNPSLSTRHVVMASNESEGENRWEDWTSISSNSMWHKNINSLNHICSTFKNKAHWKIFWLLRCQRVWLKHTDTKS